MYEDLFNLPRPAGFDVAADTDRAPGREDFEDVPLGWQAVYIIEAVLRDRPPMTEPARQRLKAHISRNPGRPERALREHLKESLGLHAQPNPAERAERRRVLALLMNREPSPAGGQGSIERAPFPGFPRPFTGGLRPQHRSNRVRFPAGPRYRPQRGGW